MARSIYSRRFIEPWNDSNRREKSRRDHKTRFPSDRASTEHKHGAMGTPILPSLLHAVAWCLTDDSLIGIVSDCASIMCSDWKPPRMNDALCALDPRSERRRRRPTLNLVNWYNRDCVISSLLESVLEELSIHHMWIKIVIIIVDWLTDWLTDWIKNIPSHGTCVTSYSSESSG